MTIDFDTQVFGKHFLYFAQLPGTNDYMKKNAAALPQGTVVYTPWQTGGRGTKGRPWLAPAGDTVALSLLLKGVELAALPVLPLLCGLAVARAFEQLEVEGAAIKWPNDVLINGRKNVGILCESLVAGGRADVVCGIGINVLVPAEGFEQAGLPYAGSLLSCTGRRYTHRQVLAAAVEQLEQVWLAYTEQGFDGMLLREYSCRCVTLGRQVRVLQNGTERVAFAKAILSDGKLLCSDEDGDFSVHHGEASVRGLMGYV